MNTNKTNQQSKMTRRAFMGAASSLAALTIVPRYVLGGPGYTPPSETLNIGLIGAGGHGSFLINEILSGVKGRKRELGGVNVVAVCDVDEERASETTIRTLPFTAYNHAGFKRFPEAGKYSDFRRMLDTQAKDIDAVVVATPDHTHIPASVMAMRMGKHVYCEKPLGQNIQEIRIATEVAKETGVATQMGIGNHGTVTFRHVVELIRAGTIGEVRDVHIWCDDDEGTPPNDGSLYWKGRRPNDRPAVPKHLNWDLWLGPAPYRPYHPCYHPLSWRDWWDFGNGRLGDIGCHTIDLVFWALDLKYPLTVEAQGPRANGEVTARSMSAHWTFPARGDLPPVALTWYHGGKRPALLKEVNLPDWRVAVLFVGTEGMLITEVEVRPPRFELHPKEKFANFKIPAPTIPYSIGHTTEWIKACKTGSPTSAPFGYSGPLTETVLLGNVAYRAGEKLYWDPVNLKATNCPEADRFIRREPRKGWAL